MPQPTIVCCLLVLGDTGTRTPMAGGALIRPKKKYENFREIFSQKATPHSKMFESLLGVAFCLKNWDKNHTEPRVGVSLEDPCGWGPN